MNRSFETGWKLLNSSYGRLAFLRSGCSDAVFRPDCTTASVRDTLTILVMIGNRFDRHSLKKHDEKHRCVIVFVDLRFVFEK